MSIVICGVVIRMDLRLTFGREGGAIHGIDVFGSFMGDDLMEARILIEWDCIIEVMKGNVHVSNSICSVMYW